MTRSGIRKLDAVVAKLLGPKGCPWDREQTHKSLIPFLREESAELAAALKGGRWHEIEDELGDILFHVLFHARLGRKRFNLETVAESQALKLMRRHPHVFGETRTFKSAAEVLANWKSIKAGERALRAKEVSARNRRKG
ncbi:MAG: MazG nucleotide pyrophosphohydrolase domain-containing protein [Elusimicrobiota bacterium]|nr:MazG nucleotide pyrophosphohydrolase domain-containing protein [Elusimicrobiota bacterium]